MRYQQEIADTLRGFYSRCWWKVTLSFWRRAIRAFEHLWVFWTLSIRI